MAPGIASRLDQREMRVCVERIRCHDAKEIEDRSLVVAAIILRPRQGATDIRVERRGLRDPLSGARSEEVVRFLQDRGSFERTDRCEER